MCKGSASSVTSGTSYKTAKSVATSPNLGKAVHRTSRSLDVKRATSAARKDIDRSREKSIANWDLALQKRLRQLKINGEDEEARQHIVTYLGSRPEHGTKDPYLSYNLWKVLDSKDLDGEDLPDSWDIAEEYDFEVFGYRDIEDRLRSQSKWGTFEGPFLPVIPNADMPAEASNSTEHNSLQQQRSLQVDRSSRIGLSLVGPGSGFNIHQDPWTPLEGIHELHEQAPVLDTHLTASNLKNPTSLPILRKVRTCHILILLGFLTITGSLAPAVWRLADGQHWSDGFSMAQYVLEVGVFVVSCVAAIHSRTCTCWRKQEEKVAEHEMHDV